VCSSDLEEALAVVPAGKKFYIEIYAPGYVPLLKETIARSPLRPEQVVVISFERKAVAAAKQQIAGIRGLWIVSVKKDKATGVATPAPEEIVNVLKEIRADGVDCSASDAIDAGFVRHVRDAGFGFHVWTVDDAETARRFMSYGVQSITTNRPAWIREQLAGGPAAR
jgi:glycerophosphoryl diester phosphodiesterase